MQGVSRHAYLYRFENPTYSLHPHLVTINTYAEDLVISSLNVRGLSNTMKRRETFCWLKLKKTTQFIFFKKFIVLTRERDLVDFTMGFLSCF